MQKIKESSSNKKLSLIYLANEIVQQSRIRKKEEFVKAYDPIIVEATTAAYKGSSQDVQNKIRRVVEVWRQRHVFRTEIQQQIEASLDEIDRSRAGRKPALGGSLFSASSVPPELAPVAPLATALQKADLIARPAISAANQDYEKISNPNTPVPTPPIYAANLGALFKKLATAEGAVYESIKARQALITGLEKLLETNKAKLGAEQAQAADLSKRKDIVDGRKREVEDGILRGMSDAEQHAISNAPFPSTGLSSTAISRPDVEALTPPPVESFTPVGSPQLQAQQLPTVPDDVFPEPVAHPVEPVAVLPAGGSPQLSPPATAISSSVNTAPGIHPSGHVSYAAPSADHGAQVQYERTVKKRKVSAVEDEMAAFKGDEVQGIDASLEGLI